MVSDFLIIQLGNCGLFWRINPDRISEILSKFPFQLNKFSKGDIVVSKGESVHDLKIVVGGSLSAIMNDDNGKTLKVDNFKVGQSLAPAFLFTKDQSYPVVVIANEESQILRISKEVLLQIFVEEQKVLENYLTLVSNIVQTLTKKVRILTLKTMKAKICFLLLNESNIKKSKFIKFGRQEMADYLGVERPSLSRTLGKLQNDGLIKLHGKEIELIDIEEIKKSLP